MPTKDSNRDSTLVFLKYQSLTFKTLQKENTTMNASLVFKKEIIQRNYLNQIAQSL